MSEIKFVTNGYKIPLTLEVEVDGIRVTYTGITGGFEFRAWTADREKAFNAVKKIVDAIIRERSDYKHFVSWRTESLEVVGHDARYGYALIEWKYYVRDSG
jgi:hypothetical protein